MFSVTKAAVLAADTVLAVLCSYPSHKLSEKDSMQDRLIRASWVSKEFTAVLSIALVAWALIAQRSILWQPWTPASCLTAALATLGLAFRMWSMQVLGKHFTFQVGIRCNHRLVKTGPYKIVRHPSYIGGAVGYVALAMFLQLPAVVTAGSAALLAAFFGMRIPNEEQVMAQYFQQEWTQFCSETRWRLLPGIF